MKKILFALLAIGLCVHFGVITGYAADLTLKLGHIRDLKHPSHQGALKFAALIEEGTGGRIKVKVFPNSQLGGIQEMFTQVSTGDLQMVYGGINTFGFIDGGDAFEITAIPFLFRDYDHMRNSLLADFFKPVIADAEKKTGIKIMNIAGDTTPRGLTANRPIRTPADFKGLKIRTAASEVVVRSMKKLGALPQQIAFAELYMALRTGVVDAQENGVIVVATKSLYEVQQYYMKTDYIRDVETFYINPAVWQKLSKEDRKILMDASNQAGTLVTELTQKKLQEAYDQLKGKMTVIAPPELKLDEVRKELKGLFNDWEGEKWPKGLLQKIGDM
jgi:tripartite ATP-independent transporter DctP family solute receptor